MNKNLFQKTLARENDGRPPVWFMRQAGRYHSHYQNLKSQYSFVEICKKPEVACEAAMGPIEDFDFDAAILFSDILFPLEAMGMGLSYDPAPTLSWHVRTPEDAQRLISGSGAAEQLQFQAEAIRLTRARLPQSKGLLGFVGGPSTLYCYAVEGSHKGQLDSALAGLADGRYDIFCDKLADLLIENMCLQAQAGVDTVAVLDTCAGEFTPEQYRTHIVPVLNRVISGFVSRYPNVPVTYYSKNTDARYWASLVELPISALGVDWHQDIVAVLSDWGDRWAIQGNIDPQWLFLETDELVHRLTEVFSRVKELPASARRGWVCGLGHGILPGTPEQNVLAFLNTQRELFHDHRSEAA
ncbi:MAG: uroporphyrinogen decarboxylase [Gammaproteobacteria bacterium]|nr:uroporphyrinogen decarboxylase [Gammaproteobacteria bacterium]